MSKHILEISITDCSVDDEFLGVIISIDRDVRTIDNVYVSNSKDDIIDAATVDYGSIDIDDQTI